MMLTMRVSSAIIVVLLAVESVHSQLTCDEQRAWSNLDGAKCYKVFNGDLIRTYERASAICESYGSRLVIISDQYENDRVAEMVVDGNGNPESFYLGLSRLPQDNCAVCNELHWSNGETANHYQGFWSDDQPEETDGDCVYVTKNAEDYTYDRPYTWMYGNCLTKRAFVCEKMAAPANSFHCFSGGFVDEGKVCNNVTDCEDGSDELACSSSFHYYQTGASGILDRSAFPYDNAQTMTWAIETPVGSNVYVTFTNVDTEEGADYIDIYSGSVIESMATRVGQLDGSIQSAQTYRSVNNMMLIKFSSDNFFTRTGFQATYNSLSSSGDHTIDLTARRDVWDMYTLEPVVSDPANFHSFLPQYDYVIVIKTESESQRGPLITLKIEEVVLNSDDKLMFFDGRTPSAPLLADYCQSDDCNNYKTVYSTGQYMSILLSTNQGLRNDVTFKFSYRQGCYFESTAKYGTLFTPGYPRNIDYPNFVECTWSINVDEPIAIYFDQDSNLIDEDYGRQFNGDFLEMSVDNNPVEFLSTSDFRGLTFRSNGLIELMLKTSPTRASRGFLATWSIACENPEYDPNSMTISTSTADYYYTFSMTITCANGYDFHQEQIPANTPSVNVECGYMGLWKTYHRVPKCTPVYCGDVPMIANGYIESSTGSVYGDVAMYQCFQGSTLQPAFGSTDNQITCQSNKQWSNRPSCNAKSCPNTINTFITNGNASGSGNSIGSIYRYQCDAGFQIVGEPVIFCTKDGTWTQNNEPTCERVTCMLPEVEQGSYTGFNVAPDDLIDFEQERDIQCNTGYENVGYTTVKCLEDRTLDGTPDCININECDNNPCDTYCHDTIGSFYCSCNDGYELHSNGLTCLDIDECARNIDNCDDRCTDNDGGYTCSCNDPGYVLFEDNNVSGYVIPAGESGLLSTDTYHINHTCVYDICGAPPIIDNGVLLTNRLVHRYRDYVEYQCDIGYLPHRSTLECGSDGNWIGQVPTCAVATCNTESTFGIAHVAAFLNGPYDYGYVLELNCSRADGDFKRYRHCTYNKVTNTYEMQGSSYNCGEVDCGIPVQYPGTANYFYSSTEFGASFTFSCTAGGLEGTTEAGSTSQVTCLKEGYWDFGSLQCTGQSCLDPGFPAGGDIIATSFADQSEVKFRCLRPGYTLSRDATLVCQGNSWQGLPLPTCDDTTDPQIFGCPTEPIQLTKYTLLNTRLPNLFATDNNYVEVSYYTPLHANMTLYVENNMTVTYTAIDPAGNTAQCLMTVEVSDDEPPTIQCPALIQISLSDDDDTDTLVLERTDFILNDNRDSIKSFQITSSPPGSYSSLNLYQTYTYTGIVDDSFNNRATCRAQVFVQPAVCSELSFLAPLNGFKTCTFSFGVRTCTVGCDPGYTLDDGKEKVVTCSGGQWNTEWIPACVSDTLRPEIVCPENDIVYLTDKDDTTTIDFTSLTRTINDLNDIAVDGVLFSQDSYEFSVTDLYQRKQISMQVTDMANNKETCTFEYTTLPTPGSPLQLTIPLFGDVSCEPRSAGSFTLAGYNCIITCETGKILRGIGPTTEVSSNDGVAWSDDAIFPACVDDTIPPVITSCASSRLIELSTEDEVKTITFTTGQYSGVYTDISGIDTGTVRYSPPSISLSALQLYNTQEIRMYVSDNAGNEAECSFYLYVRPTQCSELALPTPPNGNKVCTKTNDFLNTWSCTITCNNGYSFHNNGESSQTLTCTGVGQFNDYVPDCVRDDLTIPQVFLVDISYEYVPEDVNVASVPDSCISTYANSASAFFADMSNRLRTSCTNIFSLPDLQVAFVSSATQGYVALDRVVNMTYQYTMSNSASTNYPQCAITFGSDIDITGNTYPLAIRIPGDNNLCPDLVWNTPEAEVIYHRFQCAIPFFDSHIGNFCSRCPAGTESDGVTCTVCGVGTYNDGINNGDACQDCPDGYTTYSPGATSSSQCIAPCINGFISDSGYAPCYPCPKGEYWGTSTSCLSCGNGQTTLQTGRTSDDDCVPLAAIPDEACSIGTQDAGNNVCELCEIGTYRSTNQAACVSCGGSTSTYVLGATNSNQCFGICNAGFVSQTSLAPCTPCSKGTVWFNSTTCLSCPDGQTTRGLGSLNGDCIADAELRVKCPRGKQRNPDTGVCELCPIGTYNRFEENICVNCPFDQSTYFPGATSETMCFEKCPPGFSSSTGLSPCTPCGAGRYSSVSGATSCDSCGLNQKTYTTTSTSIADCIAQCPAGRYSYDGYNGVKGCLQCPPNYYQSNDGSTDCQQCNPTTSYTVLAMQTSINDCISFTSTDCDNYCQNGGTCQFLNNQPTCLCIKGKFYGDQCEFTENDCLTQPCNGRGACQPGSGIDGGYTCSCQGNTEGADCQTITKTCDTSQQSSTCKNGGDCVNFANGTMCMCRSGFSGTFCDDITPVCNNAPCENPGTAQCIDTSLGTSLRYTCKCNPGYEGDHCEINIDECASTPCINGGVCTHGTNTFSCSCPQGYGGTYCQNRIDFCQNVNCANSDDFNARCADIYQYDESLCLCNRGYSHDDLGYTEYQLVTGTIPAVWQDGSTQTQTTADLQECRDNCTNIFACTGFNFDSSNSLCYLWGTNTNFDDVVSVNFDLYRRNIVYPDDDFWSLRYDIINSASTTINSLANFGIDVCDGTQPLDTRCCRKGLDCDPDNSACDFTVSNNRNDYHVQYKCSVNRVFSQNTCTRKNDYCAQSPCENGGQCSSQFGDFRCSCQLGYTGKRCQTDINDCASEPCLQGTCTDGVGEYTCSCEFGYEGQNCQNPINYCSGNPCVNGQCMNMNGVGYLCQCFSGYTGQDCEDRTDDCASDPCIHGTCQLTTPGQYQCQCDAGWQGIHCDDMINYCSRQEGQQCRQQCYNIFNDYFCDCSGAPNTYGDNCENETIPCQDHNKCLNNGVCTYSNNQMSCDCPANYPGDGCEIEIDHCGQTNPCQHGGVCITEGSGYRCECPEGYTGVYCDNRIDHCIGKSCPGGYCISLLKNHMCRCPLGKTGANCNRDVDTDYDMYFNHPRGYGFAWVPFFVEVENTDYLSVTAWVRYATPGSSGVYMTQYYGEELDTARRSLEFHEVGVTLYTANSGQYSIDYNRNAAVNDGDWHHVIVTYDLTTGTLDLYLDTILIGAHNDEAALIDDTSFSMWVVLGCDFNNEDHQCDGNSNFHGYLSQVNWYKRDLSFNVPPVGDVSYNFANPRHVFPNILSDVILVWYEYILESGVTRMIPSEAHGQSCDDPNRQPSCKFYTVRNMPSVTSCPDDMRIYSTVGSATVNWQEPTFSLNGGNIIYPPRTSGSTFSAGRTDITYVAVDDENNKAYCSFKVYIQTSDCDQPPNPIGGGQTCNIDPLSDRKCCEIYCPNSVGTTYQIDRVHPNLFTCGPSGNWNALKPFKRFRYPSCGAVGPTPQSRVYLRVFYDIATSACNAVKVNLRARTLERFRTMNTLYTNYTNNLPAPIFCTASDCSDVSITIDCSALSGNINGRRKRQAPQDYVTLMEIVLTGADPSTVLNGESITLEQFLRYFALGGNMLDFDTIASGTMEREYFYIEVSQVCTAPQVLVDDKCVTCGAGNYYKMGDDGVGFCEDCPLATYQNAPGQQQCIDCPAGTTTEMTGNDQGSSCKTSCDPGQYFDSLTNACQLCPIGRYQDEAGQFYCKFCASDFTTKDPGSTSVTQCTASCDHGEQLTGFGTCEKCPIGEYRNATLTTACVPCNTGFITSTNGSKSAAECNIVACQPGSYRDVNDNTCKPCALNYYQPDKWQIQCQECGDPTHWRTDNTGKDDYSDCLYFCPSGFEVESVGNCEICPLGTYKDNDVDPQGFCTPCPGNYITPNTGSESATECSIFKCGVGYYPNNANTDCLPCPFGTYQDIPYSTSCKNCASGEYTRQDASNSSAQCETYCPSGQEKNNLGICVRCTTGSYKDNDDGRFGMCVDCNPMYTTPTDGSDDATDCSIRKCPPGTKRNAAETDCIWCPLGTYQPLESQTTCTSCPTLPVLTSTRNVNSTSLNDCETYCDSGYEKVNSGCNACDKGYYKNNVEDGLFASCQLCSSQFITESTASTSESDCTVANCSAGTYRDLQNTCTNCPKGTYQPVRWSTGCIQCGPDKTTEFVGSDEEQDCILECSPGYEDILSSCQQCRIGYYKPTTAAALCTKCPDDFITFGIGSTDITDCTKPACQPGYYLDSSNINNLVCRQCAYDTYQNQLWQDSCISCPAGTPVTLQIGSDDVSDCVLDCDSGREYDPINRICQFCKRGYYRNHNDRSHTSCQMCPSNRITDGINIASSVNDCNQANCSVLGTYRDEVSNTCRPCAIGSYQIEKWLTSCIPCPDGNSTSSSGADSFDDCKSICPAGQFVSFNNQCEDCAIGYYKGVNDDECVQCPNKLLTNSAGSTSVGDCSKSPCIPGERFILQDEDCVKCAVGSYQPNFGQFQCIDCPGSIQFTAREGAISAEECRSTCEAGEQFVEATATCEDCPEGTYQPNQFQFTCLNCPSNRQYSARGSTSINQCYSFCSAQGNNDCSVNATCSLTTGSSQGYTCSCFNGYDDIGALPGRDCKHTCERGYCKNGATCLRTLPVVCECREWYTGARCDTRLDAEAISDDNMDIIIPAAIGGGGLLLLLIILAVCCLCWRNSRKSSRPRHYSEFNGDKIDRVSVHSYGQPLYAQQPQMMMLAPAPEVPYYDNTQYYSKQDLDHASSVNEPAVYTA